MHELHDLSLIELTDVLRAKKASAVELMEAVLARIDETNPDLNAVVAMHDREKLLSEARAAQERIARGEARVLEGVPLGVKDLQDAGFDVQITGFGREDTYHAPNEFGQLSHFQTGMKVCSHIIDAFHRAG